MRPENDSVLEKMIESVTALTGLHVPLNSLSERMAILKESARRIFPTRKELTHEINDVCDLACVQCSTKASSSGKNKSFEKLKYEFESIPDHNLFEVVRISGGEPLLNQDIFPYLEHLHDKGLDIEILTSGVINHDKIPHDMLMNLRRFNPKLIFSIHGYRSTHEEIVAPNLESKKSYWKVLMESVNDVSFHNFRHGFHTVAMKSNFNKLEDIAENIAMLREVSFINAKYGRRFTRYEHNWHVLRFVPQGRGLYCSDEILDKGQELKLPGILKELSDKYLLNITFSNSFERKVCGCNHNKGVITAEGDYIGCSALKGGNKYCLENCC